MFATFAGISWLINKLLTRNICFKTIWLHNLQRIWVMRLTLDLHQMDVTETQKTCLSPASNMQPWGSRVDTVGIFSGLVILEPGRLKHTDKSMKILKIMNINSCRWALKMLSEVWQHKTVSWPWRPGTGRLQVWSLIKVFVHQKQWTEVILQQQCHSCGTTNLLLIKDLISMNCSCHSQFAPVQRWAEWIPCCVSACVNKTWCVSPAMPAFRTSFIRPVLQDGKLVTWSEGFWKSSVELTQV